MQFLNISNLQHGLLGMSDSNNAQFRNFSTGITVLLSREIRLHLKLKITKILFFGASVPSRLAFRLVLFIEFLGVVFRCFTNAFLKFLQCLR